MNEADGAAAKPPHKSAMEALADFDRETARRLEDQRADEARKNRQKFRWRVFQWTVIAVCLGIIGYQIPQIADALNPNAKPLRRGTTATDAITDQCIADLWKVSRRLQEGKSVGKDRVCPASNLPFEIVRTGDDLIVRTPRPDLYGFKDIRVSKKRPVPELIP